MSSDSQTRPWLNRNKWFLIVGVPLLAFALTPFPIGCGMIYPLGDALRGHPQGRHGTQPQKFVGLWIRDETVEFDFRGQAFYLMADGRMAGMTGMTRTLWHFDDDCMFIDSVSLCGNCYRGNVTTEHTIRFIGANQLVATNCDKSAKRGIMGTYRRFQITDALKSGLSDLKDSKDDAESFRARIALEAIERFKSMSKFKS